MGRSTENAGAPTLTFKLALAGDYGVGKTSLVRRLVSDTFSDVYIATLGTKVASKQFEVADANSPNGRRIVRATVWDIMGQRGVLDLLSDAFFLNAGGVLYVADGTRPHTLQSLLEWSNVVTSVAGNVPGIVLVNKMDLGPDVTTTEAEVSALCRPRGWEWTGTSAKTGEGVEEAFLRLATKYLEQLAVAKSGDAILRA